MMDDHWSAKRSTWNKAGAATEQRLLLHATQMQDIKAVERILSWDKTVEKKRIEKKRSGVRVRRGF
jgi:hypothetical protein